MIHHLAHNEIDKNKWDDCISRSVNNIIYAYSWYLDVVCKGWEALIEDDYKSVFPLTYRKKTGINYLFQPPFTQQLGVFSSTPLSGKEIKKFIEAIPLKFKVIEINLNTENVFNDSEYTIISNLTHELALNKSHEEIFNNYSTNIKRNIKKAINAGISIRNNANLKNIIQIFLDNKGKEIYTLKNSDYNILEQLVEICSKKGETEVLGAYTSANKLCAGAVFIAGQSKTIFLFSATDAEAKQSSAMSLLIDHFIRDNALCNIILDFEGSNDPNLARFYKSFGSEEKYYQQLQLNRLSPLLKKGLKVYKKIKK